MCERKEDFYLMHKNIVVAKLEIDETRGEILQIKEILNKIHIPYCAQTNNENDLKPLLNIWWNSRCIPEIRPKLKETLSKLGITSEKALIVKCLGLSLTDQYWICPINFMKKWEDVNFFDNEFSSNFGDLFLGKLLSSTIDFKSPDITTDGELPKKWTIIDGKRYLIKYGTTKYLQEPLNEVIASRIMDLLNIPHVEYKLIWEEVDGVKYPYCLCECFITSDTELVTEDKFMHNKISKQPETKSHYQYFIDCCNEVGIKNAQLRVDQMIVVDFLIENEDRHTNNFGLIRNANTLEFIDMAPIYDNGNSLWFFSKEDNIQFHKDTGKPFANRHYKQIKFLTNFDWLDLEKLNGFELEMNEIFKKSPFINENRRIALCNNFLRKKRLLQKYINEIKVNPNYDPKYDVEFNPHREGIDQLNDNPDDIFDPFANI